MARAEVVPRQAVEPISGPVLRTVRSQQVGGLDRRSFLRLGLGAALAVWCTEVLGGTVGFLWSAIAMDPVKVRVGTYDDLLTASAGVPVRDGFPAYVAGAKAFVMLLDPALGGWRVGVDPTGDGSALNVRALSQVCPHLGCRPNPCPDDYWFHCPCHQSRYDRLGIKPAGERYGPAPRGMDRFAIGVDADGVLTIDTGHVTLGPLPIALGQPGVIPPLVANGCV